VKVKVKLFAIARDITGADEFEILLAENAHVSDLLKILVDRHAGLKKWQGYLRFAVNQTYCQAGKVLKDGDEVAVIPPVSGG